MEPGVEAELCGSEASVDEPAAEDAQVDQMQVAADDATTAFGVQEAAGSTAATLGVPELLRWRHAAPAGRDPHVAHAHAAALPAAKLAEIAAGNEQKDTKTQELTDSALAEVTLGGFFTKPSKKKKKGVTAKDGVAA